MGDQRRRSASWLTTLCIGPPSSRAWWRQTHLDARTRPTANVASSRASAKVAAASLRWRPSMR
jgi:hypothetical protein